MQANEARDLLRHMEWADATIWRVALERTDPLGDRTLFDRLYHVHAVQWAYLRIWRGEQLVIPEPSTFAGLEAVRDWARAYYGELPPLLEGLGDTEMSRIIEFPWAEHVTRRFGSAGPVNLGETILQVVLHTEHHRGQIATRIRALGGEPPVLDYVAWLWMNRPRPEWGG